MDSVPTAVIECDRLEHFTAEAAAAMGVTPAQSETYVDVLMQGSLRTLPAQGQGVQSLPVYWDRIQRGVVVVDAEPEVVSRSPATALIDAHRCLGSVSATRAMELALDLASANGIGAVGVRDSTHFGIAAYYAMLAVPRGCIGLAFSNAGPEIAPWGGTEAILGTNPWAVAVPAGRKFPVVLDMANSTSGKGMIGWHLKESQPIPSDWALTNSGGRTEDAAEGMAGTLFPLGGVKGYGLSVVVDAITGVLTGSAFGRACFGHDWQNVGHLLVAIDVGAFGSPDQFRERMDAFIDQIRSAPRAGGVERIYLPGELEYLREQERRAAGIPIEIERLDALRALGAELGLATELPATEAA